MGDRSEREAGGQGRMGGGGARAWTAVLLLVLGAVVAIGALGRATAPGRHPSAPHDDQPVIPSPEAARLAPAPGDVALRPETSSSPFEIQVPDGTIIVATPVPGEGVAPGTILVEGLAFGLDSDLLGVLQIGDLTVASGVTRVASDGSFSMALRWDGTLPDSAMDGAIVFAETDQPDYDLGSFAVRVLPPQTSPRVPEAKPGWIPGHPF